MEYVAAVVPFALAAVWLVRAFFPLRDLIRRQRRSLEGVAGVIGRYQYRVDCRDPRGWYSPYSFFFDWRIRAALYASRMRAKGWDVRICGERWA
jgi:hypothetical protein